MKEDIYRMMEQQKIDAVIISGSRNANSTLNYLVPEIHMFHILMVMRRNSLPVILYNDLERDAAASTGFEMLHYNDLPSHRTNGGGDDEVENAARLTISLVRKLNLEGRVMLHIIDDVSLYAAVIPRIAAACPQIELVTGGSSSLFSQARMTKDETEITAIKQAGEKTCQIYSEVEAWFDTCFHRDGHIVDRTGTPVTISMVKRLIDLESAKRGLIIGMDTIFSLGRDAGVPHNIGNPDDILKTGCSIVFDYFPHDRASGYKFDMTRSYSLNTPPEFLSRAYDAVRDAVDMVVTSLKIGEPLSRYQTMVCDHFEKLGYPTIKTNRTTRDGFTHSLGHGIGVDVHERPSLSFSGHDVLTPGMVFTVEPGLYFADDGWGLRIEDVIAVHHNGDIENLTKHPRVFVRELPEWPG